MNFAVYDCETTGLPFHYRANIEKQPKVIEFGGIITDGVDILFQTEFAINPGVAIEAVITQITGLTNAFLQDKPYFSFYIPQIADFFNKADVVISHNLSFDKFMLQLDLERLSKTLMDINWPDLQICTVEQTMPKFGRRMKLIELYKYYIGEIVQEHRGLSDVMMLHAICQKIGLYESIQEAQP